MNNLMLDIAKALTSVVPAQSAGEKMTWDDIKAMYPPPAPHEKEDRNGLRNRSHATQKNHRHHMGPPFFPRQILAVTPAEYRRRHLGAK